MSESTRILLVEDNPDDEMLTIEALRGGGVATEIVVARDGAEALEYLQGGAVQEEDIVQGYASGANSYVRKPVQFEQFVEAVRPSALYNEIPQR